MSKPKVQTEMVTFRAPAGTKKDLDVRARSEGYKDRSALILDKIGVSEETALSDGGTPQAKAVDGAVTPPPSESAGKDKLERAHEAMREASDEAFGPLARPLLTHKHAANCPCSICTSAR